MKDAGRLSLLIVFIFCLFSLLIVQFYKVQVTEQKYWAKLAKAQHETTVLEPFKRGVFYSNTSIKKGHPESQYPFVLDVVKFHLHVDCNSIPNSKKEVIIQKLKHFLPTAKESLLQQEFYKKSRNRKIVSWISPENKEVIAKWWKVFAQQNKISQNALFFLKDYKRSYPFEHMLGQLLHTIREDRDIHTQQAYPIGGLEAYFHEYLKGEMGERKRNRSSRNSMELIESIKPASNGADVYLTINHHLQAIAEEEIKKAVEIAKAKSGWAVLMNPNTGAILAIAQYPFFHPGEYRKYYNDPSLQEYTKLKPVVGAFEVGSIVKPLTVMIALIANEELRSRGEAPLFDPAAKVSMQNPYFPGRKKPMRDVGKHKYLNMYMAIQKSSNIYMAYLMERIIHRLGENWYREQMANLFGFGKKTGVEYPYENAGFFPEPGQKYESGSLQWSRPTPYSLAMGYNFLANSIQMVRAYAILANGGMDVKPTFLRKIEKDGKVILNNESKIFPRIIQEHICKEIVKALKYGTKIGGTASRADVYGYTEAGKTSTSEKIKNGKYSPIHHFSSCIGFVPANAPEFVLLVAIDEPAYQHIPGLGKIHFGGVCAAPSFREIATRSLHYLGVPPDDPFGWPSNDPRFDKNKADWLREVEALGKLYQSWN